MNTTVTLHCKPHVRQALLAQYSEPINLPRKSNFRNTFLSCLTKTFYPHADYDKKTYSAKVEFLINKDELQQHGHSINKALQHHINDVIDDDLRMQLFVFIHAHFINGKTVDEAVVIYQSVFGFTDDVFHFEAIRTEYFRRKKQYMNIFRTSATKQNQPCYSNP